MQDRLSGIYNASAGQVIMDTTFVIAKNKKDVDEPIKWDVFISTIRILRPSSPAIDPA